MTVTVQHNVHWLDRFDDLIIDDNSYSDFSHPVQVSDYEHDGNHIYQLENWPTRCPKRLFKKVYNMITANHTRSTADLSIINCLIIHNL